MRVPLSWLKDYIDITVSLDWLTERLTLAGLEVGAVERIGDWWDRAKIVVGEVLEVRPHPDADRLVLADVAYGGSTVEQCVTGAPNLFPYKGAGRVSLKVAFAMEGAELYDGHQEGFVKMRLKRTKIRGIPSRAMVCSEKELGISDDHEGILFLPDDAPVGMPLTDYLGDTILDLELTPNLARCQSVLGVGREVAALTGAPLRYPDLSWETVGTPAGELAEVRIDDPDLCARYIATIIRGATIGPAPQWMRERIRKAGMRPISNIVDITNYVMLEWGQPLHAFDYDKLVARAGSGRPTIIVRRARPGETMVTLDGILRTFTPDTLLITDTAGPIAVAGVMGGLETEIDESTRNILLEAANFNMLSIRRTTQALKLPSEASMRFGRGIHPAMAERGARRASEFMRTLAGGTIAPGMVDAYPVPAEAVTIDLTLDELRRELGMSLEMGEVVRILQSLEFAIWAEGETLIATVPDHRLDCELPADLVEEVARIYGYDRIPLTEMADRLPPQRGNRPVELEEQVRDILVGSGLQETIGYPLTSHEREAGLTPGRHASDLPPEDYVTLSNPISQERSILRRNLLVTTLEVAAANMRFQERLAIFETGKVFWPRPDQELPDEVLHLAIVLCGAQEERHWLSIGGPDLDYFDLKGVVETLLARLHVPAVHFEAAEHPTFQPGRTARLHSGEVELGFLGELHPSVRRAFGLPERRVAAAELDLEALLAQVPSTAFVRPVSTFPEVLQDLAVIVGEEVPAAAVEEAIAEAGGFLLRSVRLFDVYSGDPVPAGKKSLAFGLSFQAPDKTLRDEIVAKQVTRIMGRLNKDFGAILRA